MHSRVVMIQVFSSTDTPQPTSANQEFPDRRNANILSFDGGGSRGIMEVAILEYVMRLVTILKQNPKSLEYLTEDGASALEQSKRQALVADIFNETDPIHPTKVFDMIVGTSTGGLIAFGLIGGKANGEGQRLPMSLTECTEMYLNKTEKIFEKSWYQSILSRVYNKVPLVAYSQDNLKKVLSDQFGESMLGDFRDSKTVAAAVARKIGPKEELVLFDTLSDTYTLYQTKQVLLATADAPVYFNTPVKIGHHEYVDGGVGGNCPLVQAIPRAQEIFGGVNFILSVAPPSPIEIKIPSSFELTYWLSYFVHQSTDGYAVYKDAKRRHKSIFFHRLMPRGKGLKEFDLDESNATKMLDALKNELLDRFFLVDVIMTATFVLDAYINRGEQIAESSIVVGAKLSHLAGNLYANEFEHGMAEDSYKISLSLWRKIVNMNVQQYIAETEINFARCLLDQSKYNEARKHAMESLHNWQAFYGNNDHENISNTLFFIGKSLHLMGQYKEGYKNFELALNMQKRIYGEKASNHFTAKIMTHMAWLCREQGEFEKAVGFYRNALLIMKELFGEVDHIDVARTLDGLGLYFLNQKQFTESEKYFQKSLKMKQRLFGNKNHPALAASYNNLGLCLTQQQKYNASESYLQKALRMKEVLHKEHHHKSIAITLNNLAINYVSQGQYNMGLEYAQQAFHIEKSHFASIQIRVVAKTLYTIGLCLVNATKFVEAHRYLDKAIKIIEDMFERRDHPILVQYLNTLGDSLLGLGNYSDAEMHFNHALKIIDQQPGGKDSPDCHNLLRKLADIPGWKQDQRINDQDRHKEPSEINDDVLAKTRKQTQKAHTEF